MSEEADKKQPITGKKERTKRGKYLTEKIQLEFPPCNVCGKKATGIHYGVNTCESCKTFFRRYLQHKKPYVCHNGKKCKISEQTRGPVCSACRVQRCIDQGMSVDGIRKGRLTLTERTKAINNLKKIKNKEKVSVEYSVPFPSPQTSDTSSSTDSSSSPLQLPSPQTSDLPSSCDTITLSSSQGLSPLSDPDFENEASALINVETDNETVLQNAVYYLTGKSSIPSTGDDESHKKIVNDCQKEPVNDSGEVSEKGPSDKWQTTWCVFNVEEIGELLATEKLTHEIKHKDEDIATLDVNLLIDSIMEGYRAIQFATPSKSKEHLKQMLSEGYEVFQEKRRLFGKMEYIPNDVYIEMYEKTKIDVDGRLERIRAELDMDAYVKYDLINFSRGIPLFRTLSTKDQTTLFNACCPDYFFILDYACLDPETEMMIDYDGQTTHVSELHPYIEMEMYKEWIDTCKEIQQLLLTDEEHALSLAIYLTFTDTCKMQLEEPEKIERIQLSLIESLRYLLQRKYGKLSNKKFFQINNLFIKLRRLREDCCKAYKKMAEISFLQKNIPEMVVYLNLNA